MTAENYTKNLHKFVPYFSYFANVHPKTCDTGESEIHRTFNKSIIICHKVFDYGECILQKYHFHLF